MPALPHSLPRGHAARRLAAVSLLGRPRLVRTAGAGRRKRIGQVVMLALFILRRVRLDGLLLHSIHGDLRHPAYPVHQQRRCPSARSECHVAAPVKNSSAASTRATCTTWPGGAAAAAPGSVQRDFPAPVSASAKPTGVNASELRDVRSRFSRVTLLAPLPGSSFNARWRAAALPLAERGHAHRPAPRSPRSAVCQARDQHAQRQCDANGCQRMLAHRRTQALGPLVTGLAPVLAARL